MWVYWAVFWSTTRISICRPTFFTAHFVASWMYILLTCHHKIVGSKSLALSDDSSMKSAFHKIAVLKKWFLFLHQGKVIHAFTRIYIPLLMPCVRTSNMGYIDDHKPFSALFMEAHGTCVAIWYQSHCNFQEITSHISWQHLIKYFIQSPQTPSKKSQ